MSERAVEFYRKENGRIPVEEFLDELPMKHREKAIRSLMLLEEFGKLLGEPYIKYMGDDIFELRIKFAKDISRIFYFFWSEKKIILTNGFVKKSKKTLKSELNKAKKYKEDYMRRMKNE